VRQQRTASRFCTIRVKCSRRIQMKPICPIVWTIRALRAVQGHERRSLNVAYELRYKCRTILYTALRARSVRPMTHSRLVPARQQTSAEKSREKEGRVR
jgi:hypothetical protein